MSRSAFVAVLASVLLACCSLPALAMRDAGLDSDSLTTDTDEGTKELAEQADAQKAKLEAQHKAGEAAEHRANSTGKAEEVATKGKIDVKYNKNVFTYSKGSDNWFGHDCSKKTTGECCEYWAKYINSYDDGDWDVCNKCCQILTGKSSGVGCASEGGDLNPKHQACDDSSTYA
mmetsp:Transcript_68496/g.155217  ORF Transcript_68496/g.155217 Transcript_68496/m.155217 type:complete len:174 (-) Transcript_68496:88-609(-)|eukprot:CAMPEP_0197900472 /NCGR_PEP_ID=MMETSP1439-20131203/49150_1 /TAXON_ID=66791 /ORGANISM="Gonyaulax spinifera, Strain CCMP409" /LENGTH=173 /DNA_ID=CAMNT_0043521357 /DNA_START=87 /DNA_END=608 /DNA_ORIENTATION=-